MSSSNQDVTSIFAQVDGELKRKAQKQAIDLKLDFKDYVSIALKHFSEHVENNDIPLSDKKFSE